MRHASSFYILYDPAPGGGGGGGGGNPPPALDAKAIDEKLTAFRTSILSEFGGILDTKLKDLKPAAPPKDKDDGKPPKDDERIGKLEADFKASQAALAEERKNGALRDALGKMKWIDQTEALDWLQKKVVLKDGVYVMPYKEKVGSVELDKHHTLDQAVQALAQAKPHWVEASVKGGTGAAGGEGKPLNPATPPTYDELMADSDLLGKWIREHKDLTERILADGTKAFEQRVRGQKAA